MLSISSNISLTGISMTKRVIDSISNNIANADTEGYRKLVNDNYELSPGLHSGMGVDTFIARASDPILDANLRKARFKMAEEVALQEGADAANTVATNTNIDGAYTAFMNATKDLQFNPTSAALQTVFDSTGQDFTEAIQITEQGFSSVKSTLQYKSELAQIELTGLRQKLTDLSASTSDGAYIEANYIRDKITTIEGTISGYKKAMYQTIPIVESAFNTANDNVIADINMKNGAVLIDTTKTWINAPTDINTLANSDIKLYGEDVGTAKATAGSYANTSLLGVRYATADFTSAKSSTDKAYNVDMTNELVKLKQYQNLYEANMQVLATSNQMLGTLLNIVAR